jgi:hypothetical protein
MLARVPPTQPRCGRHLLWTRSSRPAPHGKQLLERMAEMPRWLLILVLISILLGALYLYAVYEVPGFSN